MSRVERIGNLINKEARNFFKLKQNKRIWHIPLLSSLCVGIPAFMGLYLGNISLGLSASLGGLVILYYQPTLSLATRMLTLLVCSFGFLLSLAIGVAFSFNPYISAVTIGFFAMGVHWLTVYFKTKPPGNFFFIMIASLASYQSFNLEAIPEKIGFMCLGTMLACFLALCYGVITIEKKQTAATLSINIKTEK